MANGDVRSTLSGDVQLVSDVPVDSYSVLQLSALSASGVSQVFGNAPTQAVVLMPDSANDYSVQLAGAGATGQSLRSWGPAIFVKSGGSPIALGLRCWGVLVTYSTQPTDAQIIAVS